MTTRIYLVTGPNGARLVSASTQAAAINHCVAKDYSARSASQDDLVKQLKTGVEIEIAGGGGVTIQRVDQSTEVDTASVA